MRHCFALATLLAVLPCGSAAGALLGTEAARQVLLVEEASEALCPWYQEGLRGLPLVHLGALPPFYSANFALDPSAASLREVLEGTDCDSLGERTSGLVRVDSLYTSGDFAYAAHLLGVVKELWWVLPARRAIAADGVGPLRERLRSTYGLPEEFLKGLSFEEGVMRGIYRGLPVAITALDDLPQLQGPALVSIDASFFMALYENPVRGGILGLLEWFFPALRGKGLEAAGAAVAAGRETPLKLWYLGGRLRDLLSDPGRFEGGLPEAWKLQSRIEHLEFTLAREDALAAAGELATLEPDSPVPRYDSALISAFRKDAAGARKFLEEAVARDPGYRAGYRTLAGILHGAGMQDESLALLERGYERYPGDLDMGIALASLFMSRGEHDRGLRLVESLVKKNPDVPLLHLVRAHFLLAAGETERAGEAMDLFRETAPPGGWRRGALKEWKVLTGDGESPPPTPSAGPESPE